MSVLEIKNLNKSFNNNLILNDVSFKVNEGEIVVIIGPSGSGKSTLLRCINNLEKIDSGEIKINENILCKMEKDKIVYSKKDIENKINQEIGMVFQDFNLFPNMTVLENIIKPLMIVKKMKKEDAIKIGTSLLDKIGLKDKINFYPDNLSGGQKQRVSIARMLAEEPKLICMDEPTSSLDPELVGEVLNTIKELALEKRTMIIVTHEIKFAESIADRAIFMESGKIIENDLSKNIFKNPKNKRVREFLKRYISIEDNKMEKLDVSKLKLKNVFKYFEEISSIPRKSGNEKCIKDYLVKFAKERSLEYITDKYNNVIIKRNANSKQMKDKYIALQAHTDMVCEKREDIKHDFEKDPIILYQDGDFIRANGTTLGADNGLGVSMILAILDDESANYPNIEAVFTVEEETTMIGAKEIDLSNLKSRQMISLDGGKEGKMLVGSARCFEWRSKIEKEYEKINLEEYELYELNYSGFKGGHSGGNIGDISRGNPIKLSMAILKQIKDVFLVSIEGGSQVNVIPRNIKIKFLMKNNNLSKIEKMILKQNDFYKDSKITIEKLEKDENQKVFLKAITNRIINFIDDFENGAIEYLNMQVILSSNMAKVYEDNENIYIEYSLRSNDDNLTDNALNKINTLQKKYNLDLIWSQELKGVCQSLDTDLITKCSKIYKKIFNKELEKMISQGVVEGGFFKEKLNDLEYVCLGANIENAHSPNEKLEISSCDTLWMYLKEVITSV